MKKRSGRPRFATQCLLAMIGSCWTTSALANETRRHVVSLEISIDSLLHPLPALMVDPDSPARELADHWCALEAVGGCSDEVLAEILIHIDSVQVGLTGAVSDNAAAAAVTTGAAANDGNDIAIVHENRQLWDQYATIWSKQYGTTLRDAERDGSVGDGGAGGGDSTGLGFVGDEWATRDELAQVRVTCRTPALYFASFWTAQTLGGGGG